MHTRNNTQDNIRRLEIDRHKVLRSRQVFIVKHRLDGRFSRFKVRQVVRGFTQREGIDYDKTYAAVVKLVLLRVLFVIIAEEDLEYYQYNLVAAFLNALLRDYVIYIEQPHSFEKGDGDEVCLLNKVLYGLKQVLLLQYDKFTKFAKKYRFDLFLSDAYIFRNVATGVIIVIYVDNVLLIAKLLILIYSTVEVIRTAFQIRTLSKLHYYLSIRIVRDRQQRKLIVVQDIYIDKIAAKFDLTIQPTASALLGKTLVVQLRTAPDDYTVTNKLKTEYQTLVSSVVQLIYITRLDYSYEVGLLYRFLRNPTPKHREAAIYILSYIVTTKNRGIVF